MVQEKICPECKSLIIETAQGPMCNCAVKQEEAASEQVSEQQEKPQEGTEQEFSIKEMLKELPGAPSDEQIAAWKKEWGAVYVFAFDKNDIFIWRPLRRKEWQMMQESQVLAQDENKLQEHIVLKAVLWPNLDPIKLGMSRAGMVQTLSSVIMHGSYFFPIEFAVRLVEEL